MTFVTDGSAEAEESGDSVKETAHAAGGNRVSAGGELLFENAKFDWGAGLNAGEVGSPFDAGCEEMGQGDAHGMTDGGVTAGQRNIFQLGEAFEAVVTGEQDFATPDGPVCAEAGAIEGEGYNCGIFGQSTFGHQRQGVGVVVLHLY